MTYRNGYREYFDYSDFTSTEKIKPEEAYSAMEKRMKDEIYFLVDAKEGEDYIEEEARVTLAGKHDVRGRENHNITPDKLSIIETSDGNSAYDVVKWIYARLLEKNPDKAETIKAFNSSLAGMFEFIERRDAKEKLEDNLKKGKALNIEYFLVEPDEEKGFSYPYFIAFKPGDMQNLLTMDCLNDYEKPMKNGEIENIEAVEAAYSLLKDKRIHNGKKVEDSEKKQEGYNDTELRVIKRINKCLGLTGRFGIRVGLMHSPLIIPVIPGYTNDTLEMCASELSCGYAKELGPQIAAMIEDAKKIIFEKTGVKLNNQILDFGHSKEATFANNFAVLYPEKVKGLVIGGVEETTLPIDEIRLRIAEKLGQKEAFEVINGVTYKNITQEQLDKIFAEYAENKKDFQKEITKNEDGTYSLPLNYPVGISDIEHYTDLTRFPGGKEEYRRILSQIPRMMFMGEYEEEVQGHYAYQSGTTLDGKNYEYATELQELGYDKEKNPMYEVEKASMHNRILEYKNATLALFGRSANERLASLMQLTSALGLDMQSKIYTGVGHSQIFEKHVSDDMKQIYDSVCRTGNIPQISDENRAPRIKQIFQLIRRAQTCTDKQEYEQLKALFPEKPEKPDKGGDWDEYEKEEKKYYKKIARLEKIIDIHLSKKYNIQENEIEDRMYDELSAEELKKVFTRAKESEKLIESGEEATEEVTKIGDVNKESQNIRNEIELGKRKEKNVQENDKEDI